ncbi:MAG: lactate racemase domain-containing protein, partial [Terriglobia bacterium]
ERAAQPFVFPAMGSHGGATAEGQCRILGEYGISQDYVGAPIMGSMETAQITRTPRGLQVFVDRNAWEADAIIIINRVKPHTSFSGEIESGLLKMIAVGMGKQKGAEEVHRAAKKYGYEAAIREISASTLASGKILLGIAVVENELHQVCQVRALPAGDMAAQEKEILRAARRLVPRIPISNLQFLIVDELGKNISGTGMDTKIIGRGPAALPGEAPVIHLIYVRDLTEESGGNAIGMGHADMVHERFQRKVDFAKTYINARTALNPAVVRMPMCFASDSDALDFALKSFGSPPPGDQRFAWIRNTLDLSRIAVSEPAVAEVEGLEKTWRVSSESFEPCFDAEGGVFLEPRPKSGDR